MLLPKISLGIYPYFPHYYLVAVKPQGQTLDKIWQQRILFDEALPQGFHYKVMAIPWSMSKLDIVSEYNHFDFLVYLGLEAGQKRWLSLSYSKQAFTEYLQEQGPLVGKIHRFELDLLALWSYAYWLLPSIQAVHQSVLWICEHALGHYFLLGRDENLWACDHKLGPWLSKWPSPQRIICFNSDLSNLEHGFNSIEYLHHEHFAWVMATALAIRGGYAVF
jgi:hypothetical protein